MTADLVATYFAPGEFPDGTSDEMDRVTALSFLAELRAAGAATIEQMNTASVRCAAGGTVAIDVKGRRAFAARCVTAEQKTVAALAKDERTTWTLPGHLQVYAKGLILPPNGTGAYPKVKHVAFNWRHPGYDDSGWTPAFVVSSSFDAQATYLNASASPWSGGDTLSWYASEGPATLYLRTISGNPFIPAGPPDDTPILGPSDGTVTSVSDNNGADQNHHFRQWINVPVGGRHSIHGAADNNIEIAIDGVTVFTGNTWLRDESEVVDLTAGDHLVSVLLQNVPQVSGNPCGFSWTLWFGDYPNAELVAHSDSTAVAMEYQADPPGMTITQALRLAFQPHIDAGRWWAVATVFDFDDVNDSAGNPMPIEPNLTAEVGNDSLLSLITKIQESYADVWLDPNGWTLHVYQFDTWAPTSGMELTPSSNITSLTHRFEEVTADELLVESELGWTQIGAGDSQGYVEMGTEVAEGDVASRGAQILATYGTDRLEIFATYQPLNDDQIPWVNPDFVHGSIATAPDQDLAPTAERVLSLGLGISDQWEGLQVQMTLKDRIQELNERMVTELKSR